MGVNELTLNNYDYKCTSLNSGHYHTCIFRTLTYEFLEIEFLSLVFSS